MGKTYQDMQSRIADEIEGSCTTAHIQNAIQDAIARYQEERFFFNELRSLPGIVDDTNSADVVDSGGNIVYDTAGFMTVTGQEIYDLNSWALAPYTAHIDKITLIYGTYRYSLRPQTPQWMEDNSVSTTWLGMPTDWSYESQSLRLYPIPDAAYQCIVSGTALLGGLSAPLDSNAWTITGLGEELIRNSAKAQIYRHIERDMPMAQLMDQEEAKALATLRRKTAQRGGPAQIRVKSYF